MSNQDLAKIEMDAATGSVLLSGAWMVTQLGEVQKIITKLTLPGTARIIFQGGKITQLDSAGAWLIQQFINSCKKQNKNIILKDFSQAQCDLLTLINKEVDKVKNPPPLPKRHNLFYKVGQETQNKTHEFTNFLAFIGEIMFSIIRSIQEPRRFQWKSFLREIDLTGFRALPIIALLSFLIGIVLTYQMGLQLKTYGANIYIVNLSGVAILREFGPLITAIIVAGRTSSSFTAEIGLMKINEEVDALKTMGFSPINRLVIPKLLGLIITLPLLTVWSDVFGVFGSMFMSKGMLDIGYFDFMQRFQNVIELSDYLTGLSKAPIFAMVIAAVGCYQGLQVSMSAESVGKLTTKSVVQAIFLIIIADAAFSIIFSWLGI